MSSGSTELGFYVRQDMTSARLHRIGRGCVMVLTTKAPNRETDNEDAAAVIPVDKDRAVLAVADGVGGQRSGAEAAELALRALAERVQEAAGAADDSLRTAILDGLERANEHVAELGVGAATTLAAVEIDGTTVRPYHVGDSMILAVGQRGKIKLHTVSHSPVGFAVESGMLDEGDAMYHEDRYLVSNVVGAPDMRIELGAEIELSPYDTVLISSDGLLDNLHIEEIIEYIRKGSLGVAARGLSETASRRMREPEEGAPSKPDDLTFVLYRQNPPKRGKKTN